MKQDATTIEIKRSLSNKHSTKQGNSGAAPSTFAYGGAGTESHYISMFPSYVPRHKQNLSRPVVGGIGGLKVVAPVHAQRTASQLPPQPLSQHSQKRNRLIAAGADDSKMSGIPDIIVSYHNQGNAAGADLAQLGIDDINFSQRSPEAMNESIAVMSQYSEKAPHSTASSNQSQITNAAAR
jgi:hypothetical protein